MSSQVTAIYRTLDGHDSCARTGVPNGNVRYSTIWVILSDRYRGVHTPPERVRMDTRPRRRQPPSPAEQPHLPGTTPGRPARLDILTAASSSRFARHRAAPLHIAVAPPHIDTATGLPTQGFATSVVPSTAATASCCEI